MIGHFSGSLLKLDRAKFHLDELKKWLLTFAESNPFTFSIEDDPCSVNQQLMWARPRERFPTDKWGVLVGEFVHNVRSALDHLVYQFSTLADGDPKRRLLQFPIFDDAAAYRGQERNYLAGVPDPLKEIIEWCQPYKGCNGDVGIALRFLRDINNTDKHRLIPVVVTVAKLDSLQSTKGCFAGIKMSADAHILVERNGFVSSFEGLGDGTLSEEGTVIAKLTLDPRHDTEMRPNVSAVVKFGKVHPGFENQYLMPTLALIFNGTREVVRRLLIIPGVAPSIP